MKEVNECLCNDGWDSSFFTTSIPPTTNLSPGASSQLGSSLIINTNNGNTQTGNGNVGGGLSRGDILTVVFVVFGTVVAISVGVWQGWNGKAGNMINECRGGQAHIESIERSRIDE